MNYIWENTLDMFRKRLIILLPFSSSSEPVGSSARIMSVSAIMLRQYRSVLKCY